MTSNTPSSPHPLGWLPNFLTLSRIATIPLIMWGIIAINTQAPHVLGRPTVILILFLLAGLTDFLDGYFARRWNVTSDFGRMIDPIADKLLVAGCLIALAIVVKGHPLFMIPAIAIIFRDILVSGVREHAALIGRVMPKFGQMENSLRNARDFHFHCMGFDQSLDATKCEYTPIGGYFSQSRASLPLVSCRFIGLYGNLIFSCSP